ncbi:MAG: peptidoglycan DD-metalloendopeptidase family protein [Tatlockia sp.]
MLRLIALSVVFLLAACSANMAPVVELKWHPNRVNQKVHVVRRGETLYAIAFRYDTDYRQLAALNHLRSPYSLRVGQVVHLRTGYTPPVTRLKPLVSRTLVQKKVLPVYYSPKNSSGRWHWPVNGRVVTQFIPQSGKKGIDIAGKKGEQVHAASNGVVAYAGSGLLGYGNLIIIKHSDQFLTAYGNNSRNNVKEGQKVKAGQVIAEIGLIDRKYWGVHFEIRKSGRPVNPLTFLKTG